MNTFPHLHQAGGFLNLLTNSPINRRANDVGYKKNWEIKQRYWKFSNCLTSSFFCGILSHLANRGSQHSSRFLISDSRQMFGWLKQHTPYSPLNECNTADLVGHATGRCCQGKWDSRSNPFTFWCTKLTSRRPRILSGVGLDSRTARRHDSVLAWSTELWSVTFAPCQSCSSCHLTVKSKLCDKYIYWLPLPAKRQIVQVHILILYSIDSGSIISTPQIQIYIKNIYQDGSSRSIRAPPSYNHLFALSITCSRLITMLGSLFC